MIDRLGVQGGPQRLRVRHIADTDSLVIPARALDPDIDSRGGLLQAACSRSSAAGLSATARQYCELVGLPCVGE